MVAHERVLALGCDEENEVPIRLLLSSLFNWQYLNSSMTVTATCPSVCYPCHYPDMITVSIRAFNLVCRYRHGLQGRC
jgi:hypothetical protein